MILNGIPDCDTYCLKSETDIIKLLNYKSYFAISIYLTSSKYIWVKK